jgi:Tol biopolymer transport system component
LFDGETVSHTFADVLRAPIDFGRLPKETPAPICDLLERCLNRDVKSRLRDIGEARIALEKYLANPSAALARNGAGSKPSGPSRLRLLSRGLAGILFLSTALFLGFWLVPPVAPRLVSRFTIDPPPDTTFTNLNGGTAPSPDGHYVVFTGRGGSDKDKLWLRPLDSLEARPLPGTEGANFPFWSADSKSIAFIADLKLKRLDLQGDAPVPVCPISPGQPTIGGTWNRDGVILFPGLAGLLRVSISGGDPIPLTTPDASRGETGHGFPQFLPDGKHFLYFVQSGDPNVAGIYIASLDHPEARVLVLNTYTKAVYTEPVMAEPGYLLWLREQTLWAQRFDAKKLRLQGDPVVVVQDVAVNAANRAAFWASDAGLLVYRTEAGETARLAWVNRDGKPGQEFEQGGAPQLSPDHTRAVFSRPGGSASENLWLFEFSRSGPTPLTFGARVDGQASFSHDGSQIAFSSNRNGGIFQIYRKDVNGAGQDEPLTSGPLDKRLTDWSRDDKFLLYYQIDPKTQSDLWVLPLDGNRKPFPILQTHAVESKGQFSPDGKWIAYDSNLSGNLEVYIRAFPSSSDSRYWRVSIGGGTDPRWRGEEIFYLSPEKKMMAVTVRTSDTSVQPDSPRELFPTSLRGGAETPYDVTADGQRFLLSSPAEGRNSTPPLTVIVNWDAALKK